MRLGKSQVWFLSFTAVFAALAGIVFWGSWALDMVPVMPDCATSFSDRYVHDAFLAWRESGKFVPGDLTVLLGGPYLWVELRYAFAAYCAALGMAYFLRGRGLCRVASYGSGLLLAFSGYWLTLFSAGHLGWFQWMTYGVFAFGLIDRAIEKGRVRHWLLLGAVMAWGSFYQPDLWLLFTLFTGIYFIFRLAACVIVARRSPFPVPFRWTRLLAGAAISLAVFAAVGLPSFRSAFVNDLSGREKQIEEGQTLTKNSSDDPEKRWIFATNWSMPPEDTKEFVIPGVHGDTSCMMTLAIGERRGNGIKPYTGRLGRPIDAQTGNYRQHSLYVGWVTCLLALIGVVAAFFGVRPNPAIPQSNDSTIPQFHNSPGMATVIFFAVAAVVFWTFSLGRYCEPVYRMVFKLPFGDMLRAPVKWHHLTEFCIVVLAGFGIDRLHALASKKGTLLVCALGAVVVFGAANLAVEDGKFCAPHRADTQLGPLTQQPIPQDPAQARQFERAVRRSGLTPVGRAKMPYQIQPGVVREFEVFVVEQKTPRPAPRKAEDTTPLKGFAFFAAVLSFAATLAVAVFSVIAVVMQPRRYNTRGGCKTK